MSVLAKFWQPESDNEVRCLLCPHNCLISDGKSGICIIRKNIDGKLYQTAYGEVCSASVDPIEKKPLYHFHPKSPILSVGTNGCNMRCSFCQNWSISTKETSREKITPERLLQIAKERDSIGIAYTYNEPSIWFEFVIDCAKVFKSAGLKNVLVTNGQINELPLKELIPLIDAANIDLKAFTDEFYKSEDGCLQTVKRNIKRMHDGGVHIELTNLLIPQKNDDPTDFESMCQFIASVSDKIPLHISRYFPQYKLDIPPTTDKMLEEFRLLAKKYLNHVFIGNAKLEGCSDTYCHSCGSKIIKRGGYDTELLTDKPICPNCQEKLSILF